MNQAFAAKYRRKVFIAQIINELSTIFETVCLQFNAKLIEFDGEEDYVHLLILSTSIIYLRACLQTQGHIFHAHP